MPTLSQFRPTSEDRRARHPARGLGSRTWTRFAVVLLFVAACSRNAEQMEQDEADTRMDPIPIHVKNENFLDMNVAIVSSGVSRRLGLVTGNGSADFKVNWSVANGQQVSLSATPIGGSGRFTSLGLSLRPGQAIEFRVGSVLRQSTAVVREP